MLCHRLLYNYILYNYNYRVVCGCVLAPSTFTPSDKLYIKIMLEIGFTGVNNPSKDMISSVVAPGLVDPGFEQ